MLFKMLTFGFVGLFAVLLGGQKKYLKYIFWHLAYTIKHSDKFTLCSYKINTVLERHQNHSRPMKVTCSNVFV